MRFLQIYFVYICLTSVKSEQSTQCVLSNTRFRRKDSTWKITGGETATRGEFPYMVAIFGLTGKLSCGGSLLSKDIVLTAAHCLRTYKPEDISKLKLTLGDHDIKSNSDHLTRRVKRVIIHNEFNPNTFKNDIALLQLDIPVEFNSYISPICLPRNNNTQVRNFEKFKAIATGWGKLTSGTFGISPNTLRKVELPIWKLSDCQKVYRYFAPGRIINSNICAGDGRKNKDACIGDSGGPLVIRDGSLLMQIGIISWGKGCGSFPGVYTNVNYFTNWILKNLPN